MIVNARTMTRNFLSHKPGTISGRAILQYMRNNPLSFVVHFERYTNRTNVMKGVEFHLDSKRVPKIFML